MKKVLVVFYSQTGQLRDIVDATIAPLREASGIEVTVEALRSAHEFPFPWPFWKFFNTFPETVYEDVETNLPMAITANDRFDLVIIAYQVWFLSPSLPTTAFLKSTTAESILAGQRVMTLIGCRNMWLMAQERMKERLASLGATLIDNAVLIDSAHSAHTFISTPLWMLRGHRGPFLGGLIPPAGVSPSDIAGCRRFGRAIASRLETDDPDDTRPMLAGLGAVTVNENLIASEKIGRRSFRLWGGLLRSLGAAGSIPRQIVLGFYILFLITLILTVVPVTALLRRILAPLSRSRTAEQRAYFAAPSGEATYLLNEPE